ncbi:MAG: hypothetical protein COV43_02110 [Deltaproteobacteria bacterium CG11_big_fil_rev_8_21_14_0_20_42_23]|nr:MAG: hypothetical protein COV43_02110 [Deltaproteobacteria bacterium CG11_big_fil_rev_8_21_14_0_20_42_23]PJC64724.1 MAG: hypothetical protein CO021_02645 [Deltaproteobacteria bacterium CG_4_9_14_0_2_um_filter_42_21]
MKIFLTLLLFLFSAPLFANTVIPYHYHGDGKFQLRSNHTTQHFEGKFRNEDGSYNEAALKKINLVFQANYNNPETRISIRLLEFIDFLQDHFHGGTITLSSGYRNPVYNQNLRNNGKLAAKASLHQYGMAADLKIQGVSSKKIWEYMREISFGGAGYYGGEYIHVDTGPARFWDQNTSKVGTDISDDNKLLILVPEKDFYLSEKNITVKVVRVTSWPLFLSSHFTLINKDGTKKKKKEIKLVLGEKKAEECLEFHTVKSVSNLLFELPKKVKAGSYSLIARVCKRDNVDTPSEIETTLLRIAP